VPWQEFKWQTGRADGDLVEEDLHPPTRFCEPDLGPQRRHPRDDDDPDHEHKKPRDRSFIRRMSGCMEDKGRSRDRGAPAQRTNRGWLQGGSSHGRTRGNMPHASPQGRGSLAHDEKRALRSFGTIRNSITKLPAQSTLSDSLRPLSFNYRRRLSFSREFRAWTLQLNNQVGKTVLSL
jgi:hypothetical protein